MSAETILFVEDDATGRELGRFNLEKAGYTVEVAVEGKEGRGLRFHQQALQPGPPPGRGRQGDGAQPAPVGPVVIFRSGSSIVRRGLSE